MSYEDDEISEEDSQPRDAFEFTYAGVTIRLTSGVQDIVVNGNTYTAGTIRREDVSPSSIATARELQVSMPVTAQLPQRYLANSTPPRRITCTVLRYQKRSGEYEQLWSGYVTSMSIDRHIARFLIPARSQAAYQRLLPVVSAGKNCPHVLYEAGCNLNPTAFTVSRTVSAVGSIIFGGGLRRITLSSAPGPDGWAKWGELVHSASGERMTIQEQTGSIVWLQRPIYGLVQGDTVLVRAGCKHDIETCFSKFNNKENFGGQPHAPQNNPFIPNGYGIYEQS